MHLTNMMLGEGIQIQKNMYDMIPCILLFFFLRQNWPMVTELPKQWFYVWAVLAQDVVILTEFFFYVDMGGGYPGM